MNVLFLSTENPYPPDHGHYIRTYNVLKYMAKKYNVFFLSFIRNENDMHHVEPIREMCKSADVFIIPDNISKLRLYTSLILNLFSPRPYIAQKYYQKSMSRRIQEILRENKIDIIHFDMLHLARYKSELNGIPAILTEHNVESLRIYSLMRNSRNYLFKAYMYLQYIKLKKFESEACPKFDVCASVSDDDARFLKKMSPSARFVVVPNGVDTAYFAPGEHSVKPYSIIWAGSMEDMYNSEAVDFFLDEIYPLIKKDIPNVSFVVVGKAPTKKLLSLAEDDTKITPVGYVDDVRPYINSAAVYIAPLKSGGGTKLKVLNALSMSKPVVTTSVGVEGIEAVNNEHLIIADNPKVFAERTIHLLENPDYALKLGINGRKLIVDKYDWEIIGEKMNNIYEELINSKHG